MGNFFDALVNYLVEVIAATASQTFILLGPGLILAFIMYIISEALRKQALMFFSDSVWVYFTAPGTVIHELGHALFALLFGHRITEMKLFSPDPTTNSLGHVNHAYHKDNLYHRVGNFFIGIGPIIFGSIVIFFSSKVLVGSEVFLPLQELSINISTFSAFESILGFIGEVFKNAGEVFSILWRWENLTKWQFYLFLYLIFAIGSHLKLSPADIQSAGSGFTVLVGIIFVFNFLFLWISDSATTFIIFISETYSFFYAIMIFTIVLNIAFILIFLLFMLVRQAFTRATNRYY